MILPLLERINSYKRMLVVVVYLSMFLDNILLTVVVPIIPDYLYTSDQEEHIPIVPLYSEKSDIELSNKEPALINTSPLPQCQENSVQSDMSPATQSAPKSSLHKEEEEEEIVTVGNKKVIWNHSMETEDHKHQIQLSDIQQDNQQNTEDRDHPFSNKYTQTRKQKTSRRYKREVKHEDKYRNIFHYANSDNYVPTSPMFEKFDTIQQFQKHKVSRGNSLTGDHNISPTEERKELGHEDGRKEKSKIQFRGKLEYTQNHIARTLRHNYSKNIKSLMVPDDLFVQEMSIQHNRSGEEPNNTGQHLVLHNWNADAPSKSEPSSNHATVPSNCNFSSNMGLQDAGSSGAGVIFTPRGVIDENGRVGLLLSSKALVQLVMNPVVGAVTAHVGYHLPLFVGSINLLVAALLFAFGERFMILLLARSLQGIASACISVSGMCLVAEQFPDDVVRSKVMGVVLGSMALGVLLGYPFGSLLYDFVGKMAPFVIISVAVFLNGVLQLFVLDLKPVPDRQLVSTSWHRLLSDCHVMLIAGAIWLSTSIMAILEPCMPIWLMDNIKPQKWQLGMVFIPDSVGYLLGTNFFGPVACNLGRWRVAVSALMLVGISTVLVPSASSVSQLAVPHFGIGLGIGVVDAALVPLLASLMDSRYAAHYGSVYALQQMAVSLAYSLGPLVGGEMVRAIGFPWLMRSVGLLNLLYCPLLIFTSHDVGIPITTLNSSLVGSAPAVNYKTSTASDQTANNTKNLYRRFLNSEDSD